MWKTKTTFAKLSEYPLNYSVYIAKFQAPHG
jgi:hypothetical protein